MKAIIDIQKDSIYAKHNGLIYEVGELLKGMAALKGLNPNFPDNLTDFKFDELIIVDIQKEMKRTIENSEKYGVDFNNSELDKLQKYLKQKGIINT